MSLSYGACNSGNEISTSIARTNAKHELKNLNTFQIQEVAREASYAYSQGNPVPVGGANHNNGVLNERRFLNALRGPNGEKIQYTLEGSCCYYKKSRSSYGMLDKYVLQYGERKVMLFLNPFEKGELKAPRGFTYVK